MLLRPLSVLLCVGESERLKFMLKDGHVKKSAHSFLRTYIRTYILLNDLLILAVFSDCVGWRLPGQRDWIREQRVELNPLRVPSVAMTTAMTTVEIERKTTTDDALVGTTTMKIYFIFLLVCACSNGFFLFLLTL